MAANPNCQRPAPLVFHHLHTDYSTLQCPFAPTILALLVGGGRGPSLRRALASLKPEPDIFLERSPCLVAWRLKGCAGPGKERSCAEAAGPPLSPPVQVQANRRPAVEMPPLPVQVPATFRPPFVPHHFVHTRLLLSLRVGAT
jgi:hypothetical protein